MKYYEFKNIFSKLPVITTKDIYSAIENPRVLITVQLNTWQKKGLIVKLKKGLYLLNEQDRKIHPSRIFLANILYSPSYVSTEYALGYYGLIPEKVTDVTSVTTKKTAKFVNRLGMFIYQHVKTDLFFGFTEIKDENKLPILIAEPEKAMLDFIYLNRSEFKDQDKDIFNKSYRFQNLNILKKKKLLGYARRFNKKTILDITYRLLDFITEYA
ncbi:MAG: hypothetical protein ABIK61_04810 [candidate division WOR-3 bacterium]